MPEKKPWIGTSWKMNKTRDQAREFAGILASSSVARTGAAKLFVIPPFTSIADVAKLLVPTAVRVGAQNMHWAPAGAWTGEISAAMLLDVGASLVEIGHSERRTHFGETDEMVALKTKTAIANGLLAREVRFALSGLNAADRGKIVIAYEPVWSIGEGGVPADPDFAESQHRGIKDVSESLFSEPVDVVYGGNVNPDNCVALVSRAHIDGLFIGRSAWDAYGYIGIIEKVVGALA